MELSSIATIPTKYGDFKSISVRGEGGADHLVVFKGNLEKGKSIPLRIHSECLTGDAFGSLKCDCGEQLDYAMKYIFDQGIGVIIYLRQEGRGIGLFNKINAYHLQDEGLDTVEANLALGFEADSREFSLAADIIKALKIESIDLLTNNPKKQEGLIESGIKIENRVPVRIVPNSKNEEYLNTKRTFFKHAI